MSDFEKYRSGLSDPAEHAAAITPDDATDLATPARAIRVGGSGDVVVVTTGGDEVTITGTAAGEILPVRVARVKATGTTATGLLALW